MTINCCPDLLPQLLASGSTLGGERKNPGLRKVVSQGLQRIAQLVAREPVTLRANDQEWASAGGEEIEQLPIAFLRRHIHID